MTLRRAATEAPFAPEDAHRAELFAQHAASAFLLQELAEHRRRLAEKVDELEELNQHKDAFVAGVSHELRTPLTAIIGNVMTVAGLGDMLGAEERRELLVAAERQAKSLGELLEKVKRCSEIAGYASIDEFVTHVLEKEIKKIMPPEEGDSASAELVKKRLQGLGYID